MKKNNFKFIYNSITFKIVIIIIIILTPLISLLIYNNYQSRISLLKQVEDTNRNMLESYLLQIDSQLKNCMSYSLDMAVFQNDPYMLTTENDESDVAVTQYQIYNNFTNKLLANNLIDAFFLYIKNKNYFIIASRDGVSSVELNGIKNYVLLNFKSLNSENSLPKSNWNFCNIANTKGLINLSYQNTNIICGAYSNTDKILNEYIKNDLTSSKFSFLPSNVLSIEKSKLSPETILISCKSLVSDVYLVEYIPKKDILYTLPFIQRYILLISVVFIFMMPLLILLMKYTVVDPLQKLTKAMSRIRQGDLTHRIEFKGASNEFEFVNTTFNEMMDTVQNLKINVYEEQIKVQKAQLRNLQLQIKPHFLINSLNMVNNLIYTENITVAKKLILYTIDYFRYMIKVDIDFVPLSEEIKHVTNYLQIQKIRYTDKFTYTININQLIEDILIPPMLIQNFVENSIKYAIEMSSKINISINIEYLEIDYYPYAKIIISDTGIGYPTTVLRRLNSGKKPLNSLGNNVGIYNSIQRLKILFNGKASWKFFNDNGAVSELILPAIFDNSNE